MKIIILLLIGLLVCASLFGLFNNVSFDFGKESETSPIVIAPGEVYESASETVVETEAESVVETEAVESDS